LGKPRAFWELTRLEHGLLLGVSAVIGEVVAFGGVPGFDLMLLGFLSPLFIEVGAFAINDYFDLEADQINKRVDRPLVRGDLVPGHALWLSVFAFLAGVFTASLISFSCLLIVLLFAFLSFYYAWFLKKLAVLGNLVIAFSMAIPFMFGSIAVIGTVSASVYLLSLAAFLLGFGREIMKSIQDMRGDKLTGRRTLPILVGKESAAWHASFFMLLGAVVLIMPFFQAGFFYLDWNFLALAVSADYVLLLVLPDAFRAIKLERARKATLLAMSLAVLGFLVGAIY